MLNLKQFIVLPVFFAANFASALAAVPVVSFVSPEDGEQVESGTITVVGSYSNATSISFSIDNGESVAANLASGGWNTVVETSALALGEHIFTVTAKSDSGEVSTDISIEVVEAEIDERISNITYHSSVDETELSAVLFAPPEAASAQEAIPLVVHLHGGGGFGEIDAAMTDELGSRGWIGISPDGRDWGLGRLGCFPGAPSFAYVDSDDPNVGPGEQDILDAIAWVKENYDIDSERIYLTGFSMGGRGAYSIGLKNPGMFAAIAPMAAPVDMFDNFATRPEPAACKQGITGGVPGDSDVVDTMYRITSGRFLIENAYNLPVFVGHGMVDPIALNIQGTPNALLNGWHMTTDNSWDACSGDESLGLCFGHTPTLQELAEYHPDGYSWGYHFAAGVSHAQDKTLISGGSYDNGSLGTAKPEDATKVQGTFDFFDQHVRNPSPETVFYKTYTDSHNSSYWLKLTSAVSWQDTPAAVRIKRDKAMNALQIRASRTLEIEVDLDQAQLQSWLPLTLSFDRLNDAVYDPAILVAEGKTQTSSVVLTSDEISASSKALIFINGRVLSDDEYSIQDGSLVIHSLTIDSLALGFVYIR
ncbi:hypothetical protein SG34_003425 [Thalassomonas viridans]|uniref:Peptidase S9 prolyl oligopeptidase catalytic domain-containing protein n=1 Tax=Thalassomonas viridans TaxID=137584 RepID=A0AAE9Z4P9_9GAMM|nr:Ig-like domain-containing protein [Thalassomonas viridans]WDE05994.1 hypothetical protein SG34_003425 [Thalassomonas viridans]